MGTLRVIRGSAKGLRLKTVPGDTTRPITDKVKEALFNILRGEILDVRMLDLFGGTGAVGIEALSRGAREVTFLDSSRLAVKTIRENLAVTHFEGKASVFQVDAFSWLSSQSDPQFDLVYVAPPQYKGLWERAIDIIDQNPRILSDNGQVIIQINPLEWVEKTYTNLRVFDSRKYGDTLLVFLEKSTGE
jgi:16S rRNA (guanine(966)-N(2))-methyltransferase RsmD